MITRTRKLVTLTILALGAVATGCGAEEGGADEVVSSALVGQLRESFHNTDDFLWVNDSGVAFPTGLGMSPGTLPSQAPRPGGGLELAFQDQNHHLFVDEYGQGAFDTGNIVSNGTYPSIGVFSDGSNGFAFRGSNGHIFAAGHATGVVDLGLAMASGASPSVAVLAGNGLAVAYRGSNGHLFYCPNVSVTNPVFVDTGAAMATGTNPSVAQHPNLEIVVAFQGVNGHLWFNPKAGDPAFNPFDSGVAMKAATSPAVSSQSAFPTGITDIAFQGSNGRLQTIRMTKAAGNHSTTIGSPVEPNPNVPMAAGRSPTIQTTGSGFQAAGKGSNGHLWIDLNGTAADSGFAMN